MSNAAERKQQQESPHRHVTFQETLKGKYLVCIENFGSFHRSHFTFFLVSLFVLFSDLFVCSGTFSFTLCSDSLSYIGHFSVVEMSATPRMSSRKDSSPFNPPASEVLKSFAFQ